MKTGHTEMSYMAFRSNRIGITITPSRGVRRAKDNKTMPSPWVTYPKLDELICAMTSQNK